MHTPITIREITIRHCKLIPRFRGKYTGGGVDVDLDNLFVSISDGHNTGYGEGNPTSILYPPGHIGRSSIDEWQTLLDICRKLPGQDACRLGHLIPDEIRCNDTNTIIDTVDFALHDLVGRHGGLPVAVLPGDIPCEQVYMEVYGMKSFITDPYEIRDGKIFIRQAPGLGVTPDMDAIDKITLKKETFR